MRTVALPPLFGRPVRRIHCIGVGGMGLGPLAIYLAQVGFDVTGEDDALSADMLRQLSAANVAVEALPGECDLVVYSSAIGLRHPTAAAARARGLPMARRGEVLAEAVKDLKFVAVCGAHGKTTTTAMLITALRAENFPAGYVLGGLWADDSAPARSGSNGWVVAEVDESDGTIDAFHPEITVATNLDWDHPDHYREPAAVESAFAGLFRRTRGAVLISDSCPRSLRAVVAAGAEARQVTFGRTGDFAATPGSTGSGLKLALSGRFPALVAAVAAYGDFNAANATAALAAAALMGVAAAPRLVAAFPGVKRRQSVLSTAGDILVIEDYAHHPAEIRALLGSLRRQAGDGRVWAVFQPHRYSRTAQFAAEFAAALGLADHVHLLDVYAAGEAPVAGGTSADIYAGLRANRPAECVSYVPGAKALSAWRPRSVQPGDIIAFVGAGDIDRFAREWLVDREREQQRQDRWDEFAARLRARVSAEAKVTREEPLARRTTLRVGGPARVYAEPANPDDLAQLLQAAGEAGHRVYALGRGSNLIIPDEGVDGLVVSLGHPYWSHFEPQSDGSVRVGAGLRLKNLCGLAAAAGLVGFEFLEGIPGSVGGSLRMNAGAMGGWMFDVVESVEAMGLDGQRRTYRRAEMHVDYRHCGELHAALALSAVLRAPPQAPGGTPDIAARIDGYRRKRHESQPREPSAGCIFKNPPGDSAGRLIDRSGLKGQRIGGAEVSPVHANFIINRGGATSADVLALIRRVRARVREEHGIELEPEVLLYGREWQEVL